MWFDPWVRKIPLEEEMATHSSILPRESSGQRSLVGYSPWGCKESDRLSMQAERLFLESRGLFVGLAPQWP